MSWHRCPKCKKSRILCIDSRWVPPGTTRRRYACQSKRCGHRFTTKETLTAEIASERERVRQQLLQQIARTLYENGFD